MNALAQHLQDYLALRRSMGHKLDDAARLLPSLVTACESAGGGPLTIDVMLAWAQAQPAPAGSSVQGRRMMAARGFARYLSGIDPATQVPTAGVISTRRPRSTPHIYTDDEVVALLQAIAASTMTTFKAHTYTMVIGMLSCTGMRIGEVLGLQDRDLDIPGQLLLVRESKFGKSRLVPIHTSTRDAIGEYRAHRDRVLPRRRDGNLLLSNAGTAIFYSEACATFHRLLEPPRVQWRLVVSSPAVAGLVLERWYVASYSSGVT